MYRLLVSLSFVALLLWSCSSDSRSCSGPNFKVLLKLAHASLPPDTVVQVTYAGSAVEYFRLSDQSARPKVAFCWVADEHGARLDASVAEAGGAAGAAGEAGASGASGSTGAMADAGKQVEGAPAISCDLWTAGFTELEVSGTGFETVKYELAPKDGQCTVEEPPYVLDSPDAG